MEAYSEMKNENRTILEVKNLKISFDTPEGEVQAVRGVNLAVKEGEVLALVGESGCGKSVLCKGMMKLLPASARIKEGQIFADGVDITGYRERDMVRLRGSFFFDGVSGSDDRVRSDDDGRQADCGGSEGARTEAFEGGA